MVKIFVPQNFTLNWTDYDKIIQETSKFLEDEQYYNSMSKAVNPYGDGKACERILEALRI